jgi:hypothetical protein
MLLVQRSLRGRAFLLQFTEIVQEFGTVIPWLDPLRSIQYSTNGSHFRDRILQFLNCQDDSEITPLQFVTSDRSREYVGGIIRFAHSPERFVDIRNEAIQEQLAHDGFQFISCLQVRSTLRRQGHGHNLFRRALTTILTTHGKVWGVASDPSLIPWYVSLGAKSRSPVENRDNLWVLSWDARALENP